jgi:hypothetical protein
MHCCLVLHEFGHLPVPPSHLIVQVLEAMGPPKVHTPQANARASSGDDVRTRSDVSQAELLGSEPRSDHASPIGAHGPVQ